MLGRVLGGSFPDEAQVAVTGPDGIAGDDRRRRTVPVDVQLLVSESVRVAVPLFDDLGAENVAVEAIRSLPVGDGDDDVVEAERARRRRVERVERLVDEPVRELVVLT